MTPYLHRFLFIAISGFLSCLFAPNLLAATSGAADGTYTNTITKVELSQDGGSTFTTVFEGSAVINVAAVDAGAVAGSIVSGVDLDAGTYNAVRVTIAATMQFKGYVNNGSTTIYTDGGTDGAAYSTNAAAADTPGNDYATSTFTIPEAYRTDTDTSVSFVVQNEASTDVQIKFDTSGVLTQIGGTATLGPPTISY